jgi:hypothetical protein
LTSQFVSGKILLIVAKFKGEIKMKKYGIYLMAVVLAAGFSTQALAAPAAPQRPALTQAQIAKIKADRETTRTAMTAQHAQMKALTDQLRAELKNKPVDRNKVNDLIKQIDIQRETMQVQQMQAMMDRNPNLKPEQKKRYSDMIQRAKDRLAKRQSAQ